MEAYVASVNAGLNARFDEPKNFTLGHVGDGNLHFAISVNGDTKSDRLGIEAAVYEPLIALGGSVSAEHGVGLEKKPYLHYVRNDAEIALMRQIKTALDPKGILNPGKIF